MDAEPRKWASELLASVRSRDSGSLTESLFHAYSGVWLSLTSRIPIGTNVFEREWDTLVVFDACRVDALQEVAPEYEFLGEVGSIWSVGSTSSEWYAQTFVQDYIDELAETTLVSFNPWAGKILLNRNTPPEGPNPWLDTDWKTVSAGGLERVERTRRHNRPYSDATDFTTKLTTVQSPSYVTDRGIVAGRNGCQRLILHYFQPHRPFIHDLVEDGEALSPAEEDPYGAGRNGTASDDELWSLYLDNLRLVLDSVAELLENHNAETVAITADHGELFGELGQYGHFESVPHPALKRVPWVETTAHDEHTRRPDDDYSLTNARSTEKQLEDLGYF